MNVSSIGIQLIQTGTGTTRQHSPAADTGDERNSDRATPSAPIQPPSGMGQLVDKTA